MVGSMASARSTSALARWAGSTFGSSKKPLPPELRVGADVNELGLHDEGVAAPAQMSGKNGRHIEIAAHLRRIGGLSLVVKDGGAGDDAQPVQPGKGIDDALGDAVAEVFG